MTPVLRRLAERDYELLVATDEETAADWPELSRYAHRIGRIPMAQVLPSCDLLVSHGGQGSVLAALAAGCPQLLLPQFDDQFDNADMVERAGAGLCVTPDLITPDLVAGHVEALVEDAVCTARAAGLAEEIRRQPPLSRTVDLLTRLAGPGSPRGPGPGTSNVRATSGV